MQRNCLLIKFLIFFVLIVTSCEVPIDIEGDTQLVVQSYFSDDQDLIVYVTESNLRNSDDNPIVENAAVSLYTGDDFELISTLVFVNDIPKPYYTTVDFQPEKEVLYMLNIEVPGYKPVTASTSIPNGVGLLLSDLGNTVSSDELGVSEIQFNISVSIDDPVEHENYYHLIFTQELISYRINASGQTSADTTFLNSDKDLIIRCVTKTIDVQQLHNFPSFLLNDKEFNGENIQLAFQGHYSYDVDKYERGEFTIEMRTVSNDYYRHSLNLLNKPNGYPLGFDDIYSNVNNGAGVFAGYTSSFNRFIFN